MITGRIGRIYYYVNIYTSSFSMLCTLCTIKAVALKKSFEKYCISKKKK